MIKIYSVYHPIERIIDGSSTSQRRLGSQNIVQDRVALCLVLETQRPVLLGWEYGPTGYGVIPVKRSDGIHTQIDLGVASVIDFQVMPSLFIKEEQLSDYNFGGSWNGYRGGFLGWCFGGLLCG